VPPAAHHVGQGVRVGDVALTTRGAFGFPEPGHRQRVDRVHDVAGRDQRLHPRTTIGLDPTTTSTEPASSSTCSPIIACNRATPAIPSASSSTGKLRQPECGARMPAAAAKKLLDENGCTVDNR
jgi:hypothetical protein